jgi:iron(III) transport system permease protein
MVHVIRKFVERHVHLFNIMSFVIGLLILIPMTNLLFVLFIPENDVWRHIEQYLLLEYIKNSFILVIGVACISMVLGFLSAYLISKYQFKGRKILSWMLVLPLAIPSYIAGYVYADMTSFTGSITRVLLEIGITSQINILNMTGAILIFAFTLYPYVYLLTLSGLSRQSVTYHENAILMGASPWRAFWTVTVPLSRPQLVAGTLLVILETLNDYGVVQYFNVRVFSFAIFNAWFSLGDIISAIRLSLYLLVFVFVIIAIEKFMRGSKQYNMPVKPKFKKRYDLTGYKAWLLPSILWLMLGFGFIIPVFQLLIYASQTYANHIDLRLLFSTMNSISNALIAAFFVLIFAVLMANFGREHKRSIVKKIWIRMSNLGYAIPGAVIAVAVHILFVDLDRLFVPIYRWLGIENRTLVLTMSAVTLVFAYILRFLSIGFNSIDGQYDKVGKKFTESAYLLGSSRLEALLRIDLPLIYPGLISAFILIFIDVIKELPLTLILRPTNYHSLSTLIYVYARDEMIQHAGVASLLLIFIASILIVMLTQYRKGMFKDVYSND